MESAVTVAAASRQPTVTTANSALRRLMRRGVLEGGVLARGWLVLSEGEEEAVGNEEVGVELDNQQDDAGVVHLEAAVESHQNEQSDRVDDDGEELVGELAVQLVGAHPRVHCQHKDDDAESQHHVLPV